jgi:hypothetical protein
MAFGLITPKLNTFHKKNVQTVFKVSLDIIKYSGDFITTARQNEFNIGKEQGATIDD